MMTSIVEAALRSLALGVVVRLGIAAFRVMSPQQEKIIWTVVLASALAMPALQGWGLGSAIPTLSVPLPAVALHDFPSQVSYGIRAIGMYLYLAVTIGLLARLAVGTVRVWRVSITAEPIDEAWTLGMDVRVTRRLSSPATFGSTILLPACYTGWTEGKRTLILQHEASHVRNHDSQLHWIAMLHVCIVWFSPLSWWLRRRLAELAEHVSDDAVLQGDIPKTDYAAMLLEMSQARPAQLIAVGIATRSIEQRIDRILSVAPPRRPVSPLRCALAIVAVIPLLAIAAAATPMSGPPTSGRSTGKALYGMDVTHPHIVASPSSDDLRKWYPDEAKRQGIDGQVQITVTLDEAGRATDTLVISEFPLGMGFGAAASELAHLFKYANQTGHPAAVTYRIKFELDRSDGPELSGRQSGGR
jgi:beta-lactamase regulating signal transducer with metallopeptidase domain